jgi:hypothetical protein
VIRRGWPVAASVLVLAAAVGCSRGDSAAPVATVAFSSNKPTVALGSPVDLTYTFTVSPTASIQGDYRVFVHFNNADGQLLFGDDHDPPVPTSQWKAGQKVEYTRSRFVPVVPYLGEVTVQVGLYKGNDRLPLEGMDPKDRSTTARAYKVGTLQFTPSSDAIFVTYPDGWHQDEFSSTDASMSWKWTEKSAVISFKNPHADATLFLEFDARPDVFAGSSPQVVTISNGDLALASFPADSPDLTLKRIPLTAAQLGTGDKTDLRIDVDKSFVPARLPAGGKDTRELGIRVYHVFVEAR